MNARPGDGLDRRDFLRGAAAFAGGMAALPRPLLGVPRSAAPDAPCQAVIHVFLQGGLSHIDTFDPKPHAPIEYRGELRAVRTKTGDHFSELLRRTAGLADKLCVLRSVTHTEAAHERGTHTMLTGYQPSPAITYPSFGAVVSHELRTRNNLPPYVSIPSAGEIFLGTGYLSSAHGAFTPGADPNRNGFRVQDLRSGVKADRALRRRRLLDRLDESFEGDVDAVAATEAFYSQAYALSEDAKAREAFNIEAEDKKVRDRYGRTGIGQRLLLARRLAEAGARFLTVLDGGYDNHQNISPALRRRIPPLDQGLAALIADLESRGMLQSTMIIVSSEFGRTPRVNRDRGRDHWPRVFSVMMAGGGLKGGVAHGTSNEVGSEPENDPVKPADIAATMFEQLGIDPHAKLMSPGNRPIDIVRDGSPIADLIA